MADIQLFENSRWASFKQSVEFRHTAALELIEKGPVLDVGCGDGLLMSLLRDKGITATGVDISDEAVNACTKQGLRAEVVASADRLPFPDAHFEYVVMLDILEHVYDPVRIFAEARRVSKKYIIVGVPNFSSLPARIQALRGVVPENNRPKKGHIYWFNYPILMSIARQVMLKPCRLKMNTFSPFISVSNQVTNMWPNLFALSFVLELQK
jgi:methionine biosynthesis protein MetW